MHGEQRDPGCVDLGVPTWYSRPEGCRKLRIINHLLCKTRPTRMGFEPTRAKHNGLAVHRLNHSATSSPCSRVLGHVVPGLVFPNSPAVWDADVLGRGWETCGDVGTCPSFHTTDENLLRDGVEAAGKRSGRDGNTCAGPWPLPCVLVPGGRQGLGVPSASRQATSESGRIRLLTRGEETRLGAAGRRPLNAPRGAHTRPSLAGSRPGHRVRGTVSSDPPTTCVLLG